MAGHACAAGRHDGGLHRRRRLARLHPRRHPGPAGRNRERRRGRRPGRQGQRRAPRRLPGAAAHLRQPRRRRRHAGRGLRHPGRHPRRLHRAHPRQCRQLRRGRPRRARRRPALPAAAPARRAPPVVGPGRPAVPGLRRALQRHWPAVPGRLAAAADLAQRPHRRTALDRRGGLRGQQRCLRAAAEPDRRDGGDHPAGRQGLPPGRGPLPGQLPGDGADRRRPHLGRGTARGPGGVRAQRRGGVGVLGELRARLRPGTRPRPGAVPGPARHRLHRGPGPRAGGPDRGGAGARAHRVAAARRALRRPRRGGTPGGRMGGADQARTAGRAASGARPLPAAGDRLTAFSAG
ncbi:hypothetical protein SBRY_120073 [Actinacidiphila bryophytorum]|uniref:Uncharacterized protein n=1 Tax=Actinacidiphila bryophytorum TaxID=1436133 RepID=A0A9W4ED93_9ACTN|nr:hypothetical protein SBRY_120073 [Actinacidiphila bryophytorum]